MENWFVYIVECVDKTLYVGTAKDPNKRLDVHNSGRGAKYTSGRLPVKLIWSEQHDSQVSAMRRELEIKGWRRNKKISLVQLGNTNYTG